MKKKHSENINESIKKLRILSDRLHSLSHSLCDTGNIVLGKDMREYAFSLEQIAETLDKTQQAISNEEVKQAMQNSTNVLNGALAGIALEKKNKK